ncbi:MAG: hypothetical protein AB1689_00870 [Thermodesulfobacteriota bacterium]
MAALLVLATSDVAHAYRPFDSTDASVVDEGILEIEVQPVGWLREGRSDALVTPAIVANLGVEPRWEIVVQGRNVVALDGTAAAEETELVDTGAFLKGVLRHGSLQGATGPSIATELGVLLPTSNDSSGVGATAVAIVSQRWPLATVHVNLAPIWSRDDHLELFIGAIGEGPAHWVVRPVAEMFVEKQIGGELVVSGLAGAIWRVTDELSFDLAFRRAGESGTSVDELRAGFTWEFRVYSS